MSLILFFFFRSSSSSFFVLFITSAPCHICGPNAECTVRDHKAICVCTHGKVGEPYSKQIGCFTPPPPDTPPEVRTIPPVQDLQVMCLADGVQVGVQLGGYDGIVYVKGHSNDAACRRLVSSNELETIDFKVLFGQCGLIHVNVSATTNYQTTINQPSATLTLYISTLVAVELLLTNHKILFSIHRVKLRSSWWSKSTRVLSRTEPVLTISSACTVLANEQ